MGASDARRHRRVAFIACSGGGVIDAICTPARGRGWPIDVVGVVTDRPCGAETVAARHGIALSRIDQATEAAGGGTDGWSRRAADVLHAWSVDVVVLLFLRRVGPAIWRDLGAPVWNLHPSLLPAHRGLGALERSFDDQQGGPLGTTLHVASANCDEGPVLAQARFDRDETRSLDDARHLSFLQKTILLAEALHRWPDIDSRPDAAWFGRYRPWPPRDDVLEGAAALARPFARPLLAPTSAELCP